MYYLKDGQLISVTYSCENILRTNSLTSFLRLKNEKYRKKSLEKNFGIAFLKIPKKDKLDDS